MSLATAELPSDPEALRAFAARLQAEIAARDHEIYSKTLHIEKLKAELALLRRARFGRSCERIEQLELLIGELEEDVAEHEASRLRRQNSHPSAIDDRQPHRRAAANPCRHICRASGSNIRPPAPVRPAAATG
jgi:Transposase C of IS166 homeodomain